VLMESARPFDVSSFDPETGASTQGQYTWVDQGKGLIDLVSAWKKVFALRDASLPTAVSLNDKSIELDYEVLISTTSGNGLAYNGSRAGPEKTPVFGTGIYLDTFGEDILKQVHISRKLPEALAAGPDAGKLTRQLLTTHDEFILKTTIYGSNKNWVKAGVLDELNCADSKTANLTVLGRGVEVKIKEDGTGELAALPASTLNVCIDREIIKNELGPGDHGALISAYRVVDGKMAEVPSFTVPVYVTIPHKTLAGASAYEVNSSVKSFGVNRNYVNVPKGTTLVRLSLEVPEFKSGVTECGGIELMSLEGLNTAKSFAARKEAKISNCDDNGAPVPAEKRKLVFSRSNPTAGIWDLHVFGTYKYKNSKFKMRVDYITAHPSSEKIEGGLAALTGSLTWKLEESSMSVLPDSAKSSIEIDSLLTSNEVKVGQDEHVIVGGSLKTYDSEVKLVTVTTGASPGNDIDLVVLECPSSAQNAEDAACTPAASSGGAADNELAQFEPKTGKTYAIRVDGFDIKDEGKFLSTEKLTLVSEKGTISIEGASPDFLVTYSITPAQLAGSKLAQHPLFTLGKYSIAGAMTLKTSDEMVLGSVPVKISFDALGSGLL